MIRVGSSNYPVQEQTGLRNRPATAAVDPSLEKAADNLEKKIMKDASKPGEVMNV